jgi:hypothetical protein
VLPEFFQKAQQREPLVSGKDTDDVFHGGGVHTEPALDERAALGCQFNLAHPSVAGAAFAGNQPFPDQPIHCDTDGSRREPDHGANGVDGEGALVEERFQDPEIGVPQSCLFDAPLRVPGQGLKRFHEDEPEMNARGIFRWSGSLLFHYK